MYNAEASFLQGLLASLICECSHDGKSFQFVDIARCQMASLSIIALAVVKTQARFLFSPDMVSDFVAAWTLFTAIALNDSNVCDSMVDSIWMFASQNNSQSIFPFTYTSDGDGISSQTAAR